MDLGNSHAHYHSSLLLAEETPRKDGSTKSTDSHTTAVYSTGYTSTTLIGGMVVTVLAAVLGTVYVFRPKKEGKPLNLNYKIHNVYACILIVELAEFDSGITDKNLSSAILGDYNIIGKVTNAHCFVELWV